MRAKNLVIVGIVLIVVVFGQETSNYEIFVETEDNKICNQEAQIDAATVSTDGSETDCAAKCASTDGCNFFFGYTITGTDYYMCDLYTTCDTVDDTNLPGTIFQMKEDQ